MRRRKRAKRVSDFLRRQYGIGWKDISAKLRSRLLEDMETVPCNLCGETSSIEVARKDKFGLALTTVVCTNCGLLYLNPRPTAASYRSFYEGGGTGDSVYHRRIDFDHVEDLLKTYYGDDFAMDAEAKAALATYRETIEASNPEVQQEKLEVAEAKKETGINLVRMDYYARHIYDLLKDHVPRGGRVFEPGASWGKMLMPWKVLHDCEVSGVEPKAEAVRVAKERLGIELFQGFADDPSLPADACDLVINTRTINHMLDPLGDLRHAWRWLKDGGILFVDIQDAIKEAGYEGFERNVVEIDHPYMFSLNTLTAMVQKAGFEIVERDIAELQSVRDWDDRPPEYKQIRIIARKSGDPVAVDWPDPLRELAALVGSELAYDERLEAKCAALRSRNAEWKTRYAELKSRNRAPQHEQGDQTPVPAAIAKLKARLSTAK